MNHTFKSEKLTKSTASTDIRKLEDALRKVKGVKSVAAHANQGSVEVDYGNEVREQAILDAARTAGFPLEEAR